MLSLDLRSISDFSNFQVSTSWRAWPAASCSAWAGLGWWSWTRPTTPPRPSSTGWCCSSWGSLPWSSASAAAGSSWGWSCPAICSPEAWGGSHWHFSRSCLIVSSLCVMSFRVLSNKFVISSQYYSLSLCKRRTSDISITVYWIWVSLVQQELK